jgi:hypothetical protein
LGEILAEWQLATLAERFIPKSARLILASTFSEMRGEVERLKFSRALLLSGTSLEIILDQRWSGDVPFNLRIKEKPSVQGAKFLVKAENLFWLFNEWVDL